jgi:hypothetical protein
VSFDLVVGFVELEGELSQVVVLVEVFELGLPLLLLAGRRLFVLLVVVGLHKFIINPWKSY